MSLPGFCLVQLDLILLSKPADEMIKDILDAHLKIRLMHR